MKDNNNKGIFSKCSMCGKQMNKWKLYCNECKDKNDNKYIVYNNKKESHINNNIA